MANMREDRASAGEMTCLRGWKAAFQAIPAIVRVRRLRKMEAKKPSETVDRAFAVFWFVLFLVIANVAPFALAKVIGAWPAVLLWMGALLALGLNH